MSSTRYSTEGSGWHDRTGDHRYRVSTAKSGVDVSAFAARRALVWRRFLRNKPAVVGRVLLVLLFIGC